MGGGVKRMTLGCLGGIKQNQMWNPQNECHHCRISILCPIMNAPQVGSSEFEFCKLHSIEGLHTIRYSLVISKLASSPMEGNNKGITSFSWKSIFIETLPRVIMLRSKFLINNIINYKYMNASSDMYNIHHIHERFLTLMTWWFQHTDYFKMKLCHCCMEPFNCSLNW